MVIQRKPMRVTTSTEIRVSTAGSPVILRHPRWSDFEAWAETRKADEDYLRPWEPDWLDGHLSRASYKIRLSKFKRFVANDSAYPFHIIRTDNDTLIGAVNLTHIERGAAQSAKLGYWVSRTHMNRGYGRAAVKALTHFAFEQLALHRIEAAVHPENAASIRVLEANRYQLEGTARGLLRINGMWADHAIYARLRSD